ncbi:DUF1080 domain-containing protein [Lewinella sp. IMCC34183]|uniref:3-keto-disaccharide hydrolase n=1 Tax=Lewinella sp. IMCC34183 TaxID=2248762 RepID=UPI0018E4EDCB|nr:DUF1080 domain-containing protein [Lewinella sp. IMCC34183]
MQVTYRISPGGNSGINYRSEAVAGLAYALRGYQADIDYANKYTGMNYEERGRTTVARRGEHVVLPPVDTSAPANGPEDNRWPARQVVASLGDDGALRAAIRDNDWNTYRILARGNRLQHYVNGVLMSDITDRDPVHRRRGG